MKRKVPIGIAIPFDLLEKIDRQRGEKNRSEFLVELIEKGLEKETAKNK